ncbi:Aminotransferase-like [Macleaya cordata]|uniref:Aminotransferase-like n=1 Tax=Macleaya cordata TaxID=56857 RepID=A0A200QAD7_MACCD|nr:Aminotransferase-like [Macleaya cordata]
MMQGIIGERLNLDQAIFLLNEYLGVKEDKAKRLVGRFRSVRLSWLRDEFKGSEETASIEDKEAVARAYLLFVIGSVLVPDKSSAKVSVRYLQLLGDLKKVNNISWSTGVLAHMYRAMGMATHYKNVGLACCLTLLQTWIYDHFPTLQFGRANIDKKYKMNHCRLRKWTVSKRMEDLGSAVMTIRERLDDLSPDDVIWDPYKSQRELRFPLHELAFYSGFLRCHNVIEPYHPDRVMRQFGLVQSIPRPPIKKKVVHDIVSHQWDNWTSQLLVQRGEPISKPWDCGHDYMEWFRSVSHTCVQNPLHRLNRVDPNQPYGEAESSRMAGRKRARDEDTDGDGDEDGNEDENEDESEDEL